MAAPTLQPEAWQLECLRSRKAGEDLHQLAERLASVPPGARRDGAGVRTGGEEVSRRTPPSARVAPAVLAPA